MRRRMASLLTIGGLALTVMQWMRRRSRPRGFTRVSHMAGGMFAGVRRSMMHMMHRLRRRVKI